MTNKAFTRFAGAATIGMAMTMAANAATTAYTADDLFIGFTQVGNTSDYLVNIGQASNYTSLAPNTTITLSIGDTNTDLVAAFGGSYTTDSTVKWGAIGTTRLVTVGSDPAHTIYASKQGDATTATPWNTGSSNTLSTGDAKISTMTSGYNGKTSTANSIVGLLQTNIGTASNQAFASFQPGGANATGGSGGLSFGLFNPTILAGGAGGISSATSTLALYRLTPGAVAPSQAIGTFSINSGGTVSFTSVPEPTSAALGLIGTVLLVVRRRRC